MGWWADGGVVVVGWWAGGRLVGWWAGGGWWDGGQAVLIEIYIHMYTVLCCATLDTFGSCFPITKPYVRSF